MKNSSCLDLAPVCLDFTFKAYLNSDNYLGTPNLRVYHNVQKFIRNLIFSIFTNFVIYVGFFYTNLNQIRTRNEYFNSAAGKVALGKVAPGRLTPVLFVLRKSDPLERLPQGMLAPPEYQTPGIFTLWKGCPEEQLDSGLLVLRNTSL